MVQKYYGCPPPVVADAVLGTEGTDTPNVRSPAPDG
jgi:hypothetical protein